ncbi:MAG: cyclophilin-like fold protein [Nanoarchaeota archaeon]
MKLKIKTSQGEVIAELNDTKTSKMIFENLPIEGRANVWGEEIYFEIPVVTNLEEPTKQEMEVGDIAYWPGGNAFCIFFGKTPASTNEKPMAISDVTFLGRVDRMDLFKEVKDGDSIVLERNNP